MTREEFYKMCGYTEKESPFGIDYKYREVVKETEKAYLLQVHIYNKFKCVTEFKWIAKKLCRVDSEGNVFAPTWII